MDPSTWKRDAKKVFAALSEQAGGEVLATRPIRIYVPERYMEKGLGEIGSETFILGIFAIVVDDKYYAVNKVAAMMRIKPTTTSTVKFNGDTYLEFYFEPGSVVFASLDLIVENTIVYQIFNNFISNGAVPWFVEYEDMAKIFATADKHAGFKLMGSHTIIEMITAAIARNEKKRTEYFRHSLDAADGPLTQKPAWIALRNISLGATNTTARLQGSYWADGLTSALANPSTKLERVEQLLRS